MSRGLDEAEIFDSLAAREPALHVPHAAARQRPGIADLLAIVRVRREQNVDALLLGIPTGE